MGLLKRWGGGGRGGEWYFFEQIFSSLSFLYSEIILQLRLCHKLEHKIMFLLLHNSIEESHIE